MTRNAAQATENRLMGTRLNREWGVNAKQARYRETGDFYKTLADFPAALFDAHGYVCFATEEMYRTSSHLHIGKKLSVPKGISTIPGYVRVVDSDISPSIDVDIHTVDPTEGGRRLVMHLQRERNQTVVRKKKKQATSLACEVCHFSFDLRYGGAASDYCEVHHLLPLSEVELSTKTRMEDLAILCANCHRVVHLRNPPYELDEVRRMIANR